MTKQIDLFHFITNYNFSIFSELPPRIPSIILDFISQTNKTLYQDYQEKYEKLPTVDLTIKNVPEDEYDVDEGTVCRV